MMSNFWILAIASTLGYSLNSLLMIPFIRKHDAMSIGIYRNLGFAITFLPVTLYLVPWEDYAGLWEVWEWILLSAAITVFVVWAEFEGLKRMPVGIFTTLMSGLKVLLLILWGTIFFDEYLSAHQLIGVGVLVFGIMWLSRGVKKQDFKHLKPASLPFKAGLVITTALSMSLAFLCLVKASRAANPFLVGHVWEVMIGLCSLVAIMIRQQFNHGKLERISLSTFGKIMLAASPTVLGTGGYVLASNLGPVGILGAIGTIGILMQCLVSVVWFHEKLNWFQWIGIGISISGLLVLRLVV